MDIGSRFDQIARDQLRDFGTPAHGGVYAGVSAGDLYMGNDGYYGDIGDGYYGAGNALGAAKGLLARAAKSGKAEFIRKAKSNARKAGVTKDEIARILKMPSPTKKKSASKKKASSKTTRTRRSKSKTAKSKGLKYKDLKSCTRQATVYRNKLLRAKGIMPKSKSAKRGTKRKSGSKKALVEKLQKGAQDYWKRYKKIKAKHPTWSTAKLREAAKKKKGGCSWC